jgi:hypothetical protein
MLVQTVRNNFERFMRHEFKKAIQARHMQAKSWHPSEATYRQVVSHNSPHSLYWDFPTTLKDIPNAKAIFGPSLPCIRGQWVMSKPGRVEPVYVDISRCIIERYKFMTLAADVMFVSGIAFFVIISQDIRFVTIEFISRHTAKELANALSHLIHLYR